MNGSVILSSAAIALQWKLSHQLKHKARFLLPGVLQQAVGYFGMTCTPQLGIQQSRVAFGPCLALLSSAACDINSKPFICS